ncbi:MAG: hypothetical protein K2H41_09090 [Acetatifactor sp.]|nr:hypothetical protein [Acetatifactor sp.]
MFYVSKELIEEELKRDKDTGFDFSYRKLSNKFIDRLFNHYYLEELCENFYDSEPEFDEEVNMYKDYETARINFNNWQEPYFKGNGGMSQRYIDSYGRSILKRIRNFPKSIKDRLYVAQKEDQIRIYFYGRDFLERDYWFIFRNRKRRLK